VPWRHFGQEDLGQHERVQRAIVGADGGQGILVLAHDLGVHFRSSAHRGPAPARVAEAPAARFVLEHHAHRQVGRLSGYLLLDEAGQLFLKAARTSSLAFGCLGRGIILRQPWRWSVR
jgi:hypothetical protein